MATGVADRWRRYADLVGISEAPHLRPPATPDKLASADAALGFAVPDDLRELLSVHDGGFLLDSHEWLGVGEGADGPLVSASRWLGEFAAGELEEHQRGRPFPGPRTLYVAAGAQVGILYDMDDMAGRLLYFDVQSRPAVAPLCSSLLTLLDCYIALAERGFVSVGSSGPRVTAEATDEVRDVYRRFGVADVRFGLRSWLASQGGANE